MRQPTAPVATTASVPTSRPGRPGWKTWFKRIFLTLLALFLIAVLFVGAMLYKASVELTGDANPFSLIAAPLKETNGHVNILLAGNSVGDPGHQGAQLTDSIMIVSINPKNETAAMISVPRDLYVSIPGHGYAKINTAYQDGGMSLLEQTVSEHFGVTFDYHALINYTAFRDSVNAVGGVTLTLHSNNPRGFYDPYTNLKLPNGTVHLNGQQALNLARARGDGPGSYGFGTGDFERTQHQQQLLIALKDKASSAGVLSNPFRVAHLANAVGSNVKTDMTIGEIETLYRKTKGINNSSITSVTLNSYHGKDYLRNYFTHSGEDALIPAAGLNNYSSIDRLVQTLLNS